MTATAVNHLTANISNASNLHNLLLFICHLFIDGHFKITHILHDRSVFDGRLISEIDSICPRQMLWLTTSITQPSSLPWPPNQRNDHTLQLIFIDLQHLAKNRNKLAKLNEYSTFYKIFVFPSIGEMQANEVKEHISAVIKLNGISKLGPLVLHYCLNKDSMYIHSIPESHQSDLKASEEHQHDQELIYEITQDTDFLNKNADENLFDRTFGVYERRWSIAIRMVVAIEAKKFTFVDAQLFFANFFVSQLNAAFINSPFINLTCSGGPRNVSCPWHQQTLIPEPRKLLYELSTNTSEYKFVDGKKM